MGADRMVDRWRSCCPVDVMLLLEWNSARTDEMGHRIWTLDAMENAAVFGLLGSGLGKQAARHRSWLGGFQIDCLDLPWMP
ncbi:hypothetical protein ACLOJK_006951, partial [Asimina triloba]